MEKEEEVQGDEVVNYKEYFLLLPDGSLGTNTSYSGSADENYNAFTVDADYTWQFAPVYQQNARADGYSFLFSRSPQAWWLPKTGTQASMRACVANRRPTCPKEAIPR